MKTEVILKWDVISKAWGPVSSIFTLMKTTIMWEVTEGGRNLLQKTRYTNGLRHHGRIFLCVSQKKMLTFLYLCSPTVKCVVTSSNHTPLQSLGFSPAFQRDSSSSMEISLPRQWVICLCIDLWNSTTFTASKKHFGLLAAWK